MSKFSGIDQWALNKRGRVEPAETVHHIVPSVDDEELFYSQDNLIPVSRTSHDEIHALYKTDKGATQEELRKIIRKMGEAAGGI